MIAMRADGFWRRCGGWTSLDTLVAMWAIYYVLRIWIGNEYACASAFLMNAEAVLLYFVLRCFMAHFLVPSHWIMGALMAISLYEAGLGLSQVICGTSHHYLYPMTGSFQNPGPYSAVLMLGAVTGLSWMQELNKSKLKDFVLAVTVGILIILPATWSRSAILSSLFVALILYRNYYWRWRWAVWMICVVLGICLYFFKQGSADGRLLTWAASMNTWLHNPWFGVGVGGFLRAVADGISELYANHPDSTLFASGGVAEYAFNDLLKTVVEQGVVGALFVVIVVVCSMCLLWVHSKPLFYGMMSLYVFSMSSYPFELLPYKIVAVFLVAWAASVHSKKRSKGKTYCWGMLLLVLFPLSYTIINENLRRSEADKSYLQFAGMEHEAFIKDYYELLPDERDNARFLFDFGKILRKHGRYNDSNDMLRQGTQISADPMFYVLMGNNYKDMGHFELAVQSYNRAFSVMPNRIYPLYQLMQLYKDANDVAKAKDCARQIIAFNEKIVSHATRQMKEDARNYLMVQKQ